MASVPIRSTAVVAAPKDYPIPPSQEIILQSVRASFIDNGAGGDWVPALQILDNNGNVLVTAADKGVTVTAGDDADVSWFPGVKVAAAAASTGPAWFFGRNNNAQTIRTTAPLRRVGFDHIVTSDATVFTTSTDSNGGTIVTGNKLGIYIAYGQLSWAPPGTYPRSCLVITDFFGFGVGANTPVGDTTTANTAVGETYITKDSIMAVTQSVPGEISLAAHNWDVANHDVTQALYLIAYWPNGTAVT